MSFFHRFTVSDWELWQFFLRPKYFGTDTSFADGFISTVDNIWSLDPTELLSLSNPQSRTKTELGYLVYHFFGDKQNRQTRTTRSGHWKNGGPTKSIKLKSGNSEQIVKKSYFTFQQNGPTDRSKSEWVMHEFCPKFLFPTQGMKAYTICRLEFKGEEDKETATAAVASASAVASAAAAAHNSEGMSIGFENPSLLGSYLYEQTQTELQDPWAVFDTLLDGW